MARAPHTMLGHVERRLPVLRLRFDDPYETWVHVDPYTGAVSKLDARGRAKRWVFALLHSWDWPPLLAMPFVWEGVLIVASIGGTVLAATGTLIGWRRLRHAVRRPGHLESPLKAADNSSSLTIIGADSTAPPLSGSTGSPINGK